MRHFTFFFLANCAMLLGLATNARAQPSLPISKEDVAKRLEPLGSSDVEVRRKACESIASIGAPGILAMGAVLAQMRSTGIDPGVRSVLHAADVERLAAKGEDWVGALVALPPSGASYRTVVVTACLVEALARVGTAPAVREVVMVARDQGGAFRPELAATMQRLGERATAPLILASHDTLRDLARWASSELEILGKKVPGDAVQTKSNQVLSDVLEAYGATRDLDALGAVMSFLNSDRAEVRDAARHATMAYGDAALARLREAYGNLEGSSPHENWSAADVARALFAEDDRFRLQDVYGLMDQGLRDEANGRHDEAVDAFQKVLARQPNFERRAEMVPAFVLLARAKEETDIAAARTYYRTAARLARDGPRAAQIASALDYLEAEDLLSRGIRDISLFRRAAEEDPGNAEAHAELSRLEMEQSGQAQTIRWATEACGALATIVAGLALFLGRGREKKKRRGV